MFLQTFQTTFSAVFEVLLLTLSGYVLVKCKVLNEEGLSQLSVLTVTFLLPLFIYFQLATHFRFDRYPYWWGFPLLSLFLTFIGYGFGHLLKKFTQGAVPENEFISLLAFQNSGNIPLMIVTTLFPQVIVHELYVYILLFVIGFNLAIWTLGVMLILKKKPEKLQVNEIFNPPFLATVLTLLVIFLGWHRLIPNCVVKPIGLFGNCALPLSMLVTGGNLATIDLRDFDRKAIGLLLATKLILMPLIAIAVVWVFRLSFGLGFLIVIEAAVPSAVTLSLMARYYQLEGKFINQGLFFTHLASVITLPIFLTLYLIFARF
jgi:malate permease and related proteins